MCGGWEAVFWWVIFQTSFFLNFWKIGQNFNILSHSENSHNGSIPQKSDQNFKNPTDDKKRPQTKPASPPTFPNHSGKFCKTFSFITIKEIENILHMLKEIRWLITSNMCSGKKKFMLIQKFFHHFTACVCVLE
jgi:hypothetical protein